MNEPQPQPPERHTTSAPGATPAPRPALRQIGRTAISRIAREHPTLVVTLGYLALTMIGLIYDLWFYMYFRINILDYSETGDFLLAAIRQPLVILLCLLPLLIIYVFVKLHEGAMARWNRYKTSMAKYESSRLNAPAFRTDSLARRRPDPAP